MVQDQKAALYAEALKFHTRGRPGKISVEPTKPLLSQRDLSLAYSPGVAGPCLEIAKNKETVYDYTAKGNLVAVISNGTAVLGLGNLGALASKPVMEGKGVLFKKFADVDSYDLELDITDPDKFVEAVAPFAASWGGINLEDIKAPECFVIEEKLKGMVDIPVFHDDQHGTAIITAAGLINACYITNRELRDVKMVVSGAGAAAIACIELIKKMGVRDENVILCDSRGVVYKGRSEGMNVWKEKHAVNTDRRTISDAMCGADIFLGLSVQGVITQDDVKSMAKRPIIFACANPDPEISPTEVYEVCADAIVATGRSDYNNQVNNVMGFPYIFRGALDVRASEINDTMKIAAVNAIAALARTPVPEEVSYAYSGKNLVFGPDYIIPVPFDPRLIEVIPAAVAQAAIDSGVARKAIVDMEQYKKELRSRLNPSANFMDVLFEQLRANPKTVIFAEGEEESVVKAAIQWYVRGYGTPILVGYKDKIEEIYDNLNYSGEGIKITNAALHEKTDEFIDKLYKKLQRQGYLYRDCARLIKRDRHTFSAMLIEENEADAMVTGLTKSYTASLEEVLRVIDVKSNRTLFGLSLMVTREKTLFISDTSVNELPSAEELADIAVHTAAEAKLLGYEPRVAFLSFSNFGNPMREKAKRIREAVEIMDTKRVDFEYDGEMSVDVALNPKQLELYPFCKLTEPANVLIMPALHSAHIASKLLQEVGGGTLIGPIICGLQKPVQIAHIGSTVSDILNLAVIAATAGSE